MSYDATLIQTYHEIHRIADNFARPDGYRFPVILGGAGVGKSTMFRQRLKDTKVAWFQGAMSAFVFYCELFRNLDAPVVIDDVDSLFTDRAAINLLKCACQTDDVKHMSWHKANRMMDDEGIPHSFETRSRVCILANKLRRGDANLRAVLDRATIFNFYPSTTEVHAEATRWFDDPEILAFIGDHTAQITSPGLRMYEKAKEQKRLGEDWRKWLLDLWGHENSVALIASLMEDPSLTTSREREERFEEMGGGSRATYMRSQRQWKKLHGIVGRTRKKDQHSDIFETCDT